MSGRVIPQDQDIAKRLYEQNFQLAVHNKTLSILSKLYEITMSSLKVSEVAQKIIDTLVSELTFSALILNLIDESRRVFRPIAITQSPEVLDALKLLGKDLHEVEISLDDENNLVAQAMVHNERKVTGNLLDILTPLTTQEVADDIENVTNVKTIFIYPIRLGDEMIGSLVVGIGKRADDLSLAEKQTLQEVIDLIAIAIDRAKLHESVERANEDLKALDKLKDEFLSMASHELKSPMNAVKNYLWMAINKGKDSPEKMAEYLQIAYESIQRLISLVNDLLDVSRIESGRVNLDIKPIDLHKAFHETIEMYEPQAKAKNLSLKAIAPDGILVLADDLKLREVLNNFVSNGIKYTPQGSVTLSAMINAGKVRIQVTDTGLGVTDEDRQKLFQKFSRVNTSYKELALVEGTGLGLYICKQFIEMMHGTIGLDSTPGQGSTFWVELPTGAA